MIFSSLLLTSRDNIVNFTKMTYTFAVLRDSGHNEGRLDKSVNAMTNIIVTTGMQADN